MVTDEERREVAAKLCERTKEPLGKSMQRMFSDTLGIYTPNNGWLNPEKATAHWTHIVLYLADLIDRPMSEVPYVAIDPGKEESSMFKSECQECGELIEISFAEFMRCAHDRHRERPACPNCGKRVSIGVAKRLNQETGEWEEVD